MAETKSDYFSLVAYRELIRDLQRRGYRVADYKLADPRERHLILRHDVDFDLGAATTMAEAEAADGLQATYFLLLRTEFYNMLSASAGANARRLIELGHRVGLHFDRANSIDDIDELDRLVRMDCDILENAVGVPVESVSFHRPVQKLFGGDLVLGGRFNAYSRRFTLEMGYCSDSRGGWHRGHPLQHSALEHGQALHLLTHPIWWVSPDQTLPRKKLAEFLQRRIGLLDREISQHCKAYGIDVEEP